MIPTPFGVLVILSGLWLLRSRPPVYMLGYLMFWALFGGASAIDLPVLGHSSMPPATLALGFVALSLLKRDVREGPGTASAVLVNAWLVTYCVYAAASSVILPRIFAERVHVIPMQRAFSLVPLEPTSQNITQAVYVLGTAATAVAASSLIAAGRLAQKFVNAMLLLTWLQVATGLADLAASAMHVEGLFAWARNGAYAQLDQDVGTFHRISGLTPEPSAYAGISSVLFVFAAELWLRGVASRRSGAAALAMLFLMVLSTSSTAYLTIAGYGLVIALRTVLVVGSVPPSRVLVLCGCAAVLASGCIFVALVRPHLAADVTDMIASMTVRKGLTTSGVERSMWAGQGLSLMAQTRGLGVGLGSFRSSSLFTAALGSMGPASLAVLTVYCVQVLRPWKKSTYGFPESGEFSQIGAAAGWSAIIYLIPSAVGAPSADPGVVFALMAGIALGLRLDPLRRSAESASANGTGSGFGRVSATAALAPDRAP